MKHIFGALKIILDDIVISVFHHFLHIKPEDAFHLDFEIIL